MLGHNNNTYDLNSNWDYTVKNLSLILLFLFSLTSSASLVSAEDCMYSPGPTDFQWVEKEPGLIYGSWAFKSKDKKKGPPPVVVHVLRVELGKDGLTLRSLHPLGNSLRLEQIVDYFRSGGVDVRGAINGDYFSFVEKAKYPNGMHISGGQLLTFPGATSSLMVTASNKARIDRVSVKGTATSGKTSVNISGANRAPKKDEAVLFSGFFQAKTVASAGCSAIVMSRSQLEVMANSSFSVKIDKTGSAGREIAMKPMDLVLVACGSAKETVKGWKEGDKVAISTSISGVSEPVLEAISGGPRILRDGVVSVENKQEEMGVQGAYIVGKHPRSALGVAQGGGVVWLLVAEGRVNPKKSEGLNAVQTACILKGLGAADAMLLDGGGSAALMVEGDFVSAPFKGKKSSARDMSNALGVVRIPQTKK